MSISDLRAKMKQMMLVDENTESNNGNNDRFWSLKVDSAKNGSAVIRFLPGKDLSKLPYVTNYTHWFTHEVTGKTYSELSATTWKEADPMGEFNAWLWKKGEEDKVRNQKRQTRHYANILVLKDPANPDNEGKVFVYRFGKKILDKIKAQLTPEYEDDIPTNIFDLFEGKNFRLRSKDVGGYQNYDDSSFEVKVTPVAETDEQIEAIYAKVYDLDQIFMDKSKDKSFDQKLGIMKTVFGRDPLFLEWLSASGHSVPSPSVSEEDAPPAPKAKAKVEEDAPPAPKPKASSNSDVDDILAELGLD